MSITQHFDRGTQILFVAVEKEISPEEFSEFLQSLENSQEYGINVSTIWDLQGLDFATFDRSVIDKMLRAKTMHPDRKNAIVATVVSTTLGVGMSRMYLILSDLNDKHPEDRFATFFDMSDAIDWIFAQSVESRLPDRD